MPKNQPKTPRPRSKFRSAASAIGKGIGKGASWAWKKKYEILGWAAVGCAIAGLAVLTAGAAVAIGAGLVGTVAGLSGAGAVAGTAAAVSSVAGIVAGAGAVSVLAAGGLAATIGVMKTVGFVAKPFVWAGEKAASILFPSKKKERYKKLDDEEKLDKSQQIKPQIQEEKKRKRENSTPENSVGLDQDQINISQPLSPQVSEKYRQEGNKFFDKANPTKELFEYADDKVVIKSLSPELVRDILKDLQERGENTATISGSPEFMKIAVQEAKKLGMTLQGQTPEASQQIAALQANQSQSRPSSVASESPAPSFATTDPNPFADPPDLSPPPPSPTKPVLGQSGALVSPTTQWLNAYTPTREGEELEIKHHVDGHTFFGKKASQWNTEYVAPTSTLASELQSAPIGTKVRIVKDDRGTNTVTNGENPAVTPGKQPLTRTGSVKQK